MKLTQIEAAAITEKIERKRDSVRIFRPHKEQEEVFAQPRMKYMLVEGGNRGGKSLCSSILFSAIARDVDITFNDGTVVPSRMPWQKGRPLLMWIICIDQRHIGEVIHKMLFKSGAFKVAYNPDTKSLEPYKEEVLKPLGSKPKPAPPISPGRYVSSISWESRADNIFNTVVIKDPSTGSILAEINAYTSKGDPPQGRAVDIIWIDEQIAKAKYSQELKPRLVDNDGQMFWASWADDDSAELEEFIEVLDREIEAGSGVAKRVRLTMSGNKSLPKKSVKEYLAGCATEEERQARDLGIFGRNNLRMYPLYQKGVHTAILDNEDEEDDLSRKLRERDGIPPDSWTRTLILDPGTQHPCVLLCAVPPPEFGNYYVPYQEFYPGRMDPTQLAKHVRKNTLGQRFYRFVIDRRAGRQQSMGLAAGTRVVDAYSKAFAAEELRCITSKSLFMFGSDDVGGRQLILQEWMHPQEKTGLPKLRIVESRCPHLCDQLRKLRKKTVGKEVVDERKVAGQASDAVDALEYFAATNPKYVFIQPQITDGSRGYQWYMKKFGGPKPQTSVQIGTRY